MPRIDQFISAAALALADFIPLGQGPNTRKTTLEALKTFFTGDLSSQLSDLTNKVTSQQLTNGTDLNTIITPGVRRHTLTDADARTLLNIPRANITSFSIEVYLVTTSTTTNAIQKLTERDGTMWIRSLASSVWGSWKQVATVEDSGWIDLPLASTAVEYATNVKPQYRKFNGFLEIDGAIKGMTNINTAINITIANLPSGYRPSKQITRICRGSNADKWILTINIDGTVTASGYSSGGNFVATMTGSEYLPFHEVFMI